jgi:catechol 2,3-dioxygenase-like lactoylglutathione lyase family enzyme
VSDCERSRSFYEAALAPLGIAPVAEPPAGSAGFAAADGSDFWIEQAERASEGVHVAFAAPDRAAVAAFHAAALRAGGVDNGDPGLRDYHPDYYAAFVLDPDGNNVEAVCHSGP